MDTNNTTKQIPHTEIVFILDKSGSMHGKESDIIGGFNKTLEEQKANTNECYVSTILFNHKSIVLHNRIPLENIKPITGNEYSVGGSTAYFDALGNAIAYHERIQKEDPTKLSPKMLFIIMTDGYENASIEYNSKKLKGLIKEKQEKCYWEFVFMGAGIDAISAANDIGIDSSYAINITMEDKEGIEASYRSMSKCINLKRKAMVRNMCCCKTAWEEDIVNDMKSRNSRKTNLA